jgi:hypothetical protein
MHGVLSYLIISKKKKTYGENILNMKYVVSWDSTRHSAQLRAGRPRGRSSSPGGAALGSTQPLTSN